MSDIEIEWDNTQALAEGWGIFEFYGSDGSRWQLQRHDEAEVFEDDLYAWLHVIVKAREGSDYHQSALDFIEANNPIEWVRITAEMHK